MNSIINFSEPASIALHGIILIAKSDSFVSVNTLAEDLGSSKHSIAKVMQQLTKHGYVKSYRGPNGGFALDKKPKKITFLEIFEVIDGKITPKACPFGKEDTCKMEKCILNNVTYEMTAQFVKYLKSQTVSMYL